MVNNYININPKLQLLIDNFFVSFDGQNIFCEVADINQRIVFLNDYFEKQNTRLTKSNAIGKTFIEFDQEQDYRFMPEYLAEIEKLYSKVMTTRQKITFFAYALDKNENEFIRLTNVFPLITADKEILGTYTLSWFANPFNFLMNFLNDFQNRESQQKQLENIPSLTKREHQILFLLTHKFSQYEIANFLKISRATVQKTINDGLMEKFNIHNNDSEELINAAIRYNLHLYFPPSLLGNHPHILSNEESVIRQIANKINSKP